MKRRELTFRWCDWGSEMEAEGVHATRLRSSGRRGVLCRGWFLCAGENQNWFWREWEINVLIGAIVLFAGRAVEEADSGERSERGRRMIGLTSTDDHNFGDEGRSLSTFCCCSRSCL
jgi:hypothetical protein